MICEIFLPCGIVWQIWKDEIRSRRIASGLVIMQRRQFGGDWREWLTAARNLSTRSEACWVAGTKGRAS